MGGTVLRRVARDTRALGLAAPLRAAYETSKRSGLHSLLFGVGQLPRHRPARPVPLCHRKPIGHAAVRRCLRDAEQITREGLRVFGHRVKTGIASSWSTDPLTGLRWPVDCPWWKIDIRSEGRLSDVKYVWEAARHRDLVVLARAATLQPTGSWLSALDQLLRSWCAQSPPEQGVTWYSSLEFALRAIAWSQVLLLVGEHLPTERVRTMEQMLLAGARHLLVELPYTLSSMRNNHLLGDALGLMVLARLFPDTRAATWWWRTADRMFTSQLRRHLRPDGSMIEDSLSYHRFVLEMLIVRLQLGDAPASVRSALRAAGEHLRRLGVFNGDVPQYGDWDEGRVLASSGDPLDVAGSTALALALTGERVPEAWYEDFDELAWYAPPPAQTPPRRHRPVDHAAGAILVSDGIAWVARGPWRVWFKVDGGPSHGHADLTSVWIKHQDQWLLADPGTGTYNGPLAVRNGLRTSGAHPVRRPHGQDQLIPHRAFRWLNRARGFLAPPLALADRTVLFGWHDAYRRRPFRIRVGRALVVADAYVAVIDLCDRPGAAGSWALTLPLHPDIEVRDGALVYGEHRVELFGLDGHHTVRGQAQPFAGWHSRTYGHCEPTTWINIEDQRHPAVWGFGATPELRERSTTISPLRLDVRWDDAGASLSVTDTRTGNVHETRAAP